jgi:signal transduction histidine kinase
MLVAFTAVLLAPHAYAQDAGGRRQVVVLNSTRLDDQFSVTWSRELPKLLGEGRPDGVDFYAEFFDFVRYGRPEHESAYLDLLHLKYGAGRVDLVIAIGALAIDFIRRHRNELFPATPVVSYSLLPSEGRLANSTGLNNPLHYGRSIDLALALQPDLRHVYVISGASADDKRYETQARAEFRSFEHRVEFTYLSGLVMRDLEQRLRALPAHSAVYYVVMREDGAGERFQVMDALSRIASAANAPTYSWADSAVQAGIVGGTRRNQLAQTEAIATLALRVLNGEHADDIPIFTLETDVDQVDWRQLRRWRIPESRVPAGAEVLFRDPTVWDRYKRYIVGAVVIVLAQTALIAALLVQRSKRQRVELALRRSQARLNDSYDRIRQLSRQLLLEQDAERARISRELHDDINQQLALLSIELDGLRSDRLPENSATRVFEAMKTAQAILKSVRELSHRLHPPRLTPEGLVRSLGLLCRELTPPRVSIAFRHGETPAIDQSVALCLYRVAQEALMNAIKHSGARRISVDLTCDPSSVALTIADDGRGFVVDGVLNGGLGLLSMRERVESVGGRLEVHAPKSGTRVRVTVPIHLEEPAPVEAAI